MRSRPDEHRPDLDSGEKDELIIPLLPNLNSDVMQHILYYLLLELLLDPSRQYIGYLRLISPDWNNFMTIPVGSDVDCHDIPDSEINRNALNILRLQVLRNVGLTVLPDPVGTYYAVHHIFAQGGKRLRVSDQGCGDKKIKLFSTEQAARHYAESTATQLTDYSVPKPAVSALKFKQPRRVCSFGLIPSVDDAQCFFFKARDESDLCESSPVSKESSVVIEDLRSCMGCVKNS